MYAYPAKKENLSTLVLEQEIWTRVVCKETRKHTL